MTTLETGTDYLFPIDKQYLMLYGFTKSSRQKQRRSVKHAAKLRSEAIRKYRKHGIYLDHLIMTS